MKVLIADDEQHVRSTVRALLEWGGLDSELSIYEAMDGENAIRIIREESPELVLTDIVMPQMNGIDLLQWIREHATGTKTIVISGHDHFSFIRSTMKLGGMDYILKPIDADELTEAVGRAIREIKEREAAGQRRVTTPSLAEADREAYWDFVFAALLEEGQLPDSVMDNLAGELGIVPGTPCSVALLKVTETDGSAETAATRQTMAAVLAEAKRTFRREQNGYALPSRMCEDEAYVIVWDDVSCAVEELSALFERRDGWPGRVDAGIGRPGGFPHGLSRSLREARAALKRRNMLDTGMRVHSFMEEREQPAPSTQVPKGAESLANLQRAVLTGNAGAVRDYFAEWQAGMIAGGVATPAGLELAAMEWHINGLDWLHESMDGQAIQELLVTGAIVDPRSGDAQTRTLSEFTDKWCAWFLSLAAIIAQAGVQDKEQTLVGEIMKFVDENYQQPISLRTVAEHFHFSREHISRQFKKETGASLSDYLNKVRINKARELLLLTDLRVREVGEQVGIPDEKYFSRVFKRMTGMSPNDYRKGD